MPVINELPQSGGKWELLWTNPNPNSAISSPITIQHDMTQYEKVFVALKFQTTSQNTDAVLVEHREGSNWIGCHALGTSTNMCYRWFTHNPTQFSIGADGGWVSHSGSHGSSSSHGIPVAVYGVKRLNLG